jgi:hypothetical protein
MKSQIPHVPLVVLIIDYIPNNISCFGAFLLLGLIWSPFFYAGVIKYGHQFPGPVIGYHITIIEFGKYFIVFFASERFGSPGFQEFSYCHIGYISPPREKINIF